MRWSSFGAYPALSFHGGHRREEAISSLDLLFDQLKRLSCISSAALVLSARAQDHYRQTLEEADAAYTQVATLLDMIHQELIDHRQRFQQVQEQQSKQQSR